MKIITSVPIYRNKFQKPALFFSKHGFTIGSVVFVPYPKNEKPAIVINSEKLEDKRVFIRRNKINIKKISNNTELPLFKKEIIETIKLAEEKTNYSTQEIFQKILTKKTIKKINKIKPSDNIKNIKKITDKLSPNLIRKKLQKNKQTKTRSNERGIQTIGSILKTKEIKKSSLHSETHYLVNEIRNHFGETAKKGKGSFGFYLGFFKRIPQPIIYQYWAEVKQSRKSIKNQQKLFWWKIGQYIKQNSHQKTQKK